MSDNYPEGIMNRYLLPAVFAVCGLAAAYSADVATAQDSDTTLIAVVDYMKVTGGGAMTLETETWKPVHQARANAGELSSWTLFSTPYTVDRSYDYVTINVYRGWAMFESAWANATARIEAMYPGDAATEMMEKTDAARDIVKTEVWTSMDWAGTMHESAAAMVSFFQVPPGGWDAYARLESSFWKPLHEKAIEGGAEQGWWVLGLMFPNGAHYGYNAATLNFVHSVSQAMNTPGPASYVSDVHPSLEWSDISHMTMKARKDARFELWTVVDHLHTEE
jgi:hypothetical protein